MTGPPDPEDFLKTGGALESGFAASVFGAGSESPLIGKMIGEVRIIDFIGAGGMGEVFLGIDERLERKVAIKTLRPDIQISAMAQERFQREARILSRLDHPSICRLYDLKTINGQPFLLLEYLDGKSLGDLQEQIPETEVLDLAIPVAQALAAAHREGVIHRDLKPDNIMLMPDGRVKILDFGIGRFMEENQAEEAELQPRDSHRKPTGSTPTIRGSIIGTPRFMSPEQARGEDLTPATDLYSFGILLYELLSGGSPYEAAKPLELLLEIPDADLKPPSSASPALAKLIIQLLEKDPHKRPTAVETAEILEEIRDAPRRRRRRIAAFSLGALAIIAIAVALIGGRILGEGRYRCQGFEAHLQDIWDSNVQAEMQSSYSEAGLQLTWKLLDGVLSRYAGDWLEARQDACEATWTRKEQSQESLELENACLDRRLQALSALVSVLSEAPQSTAEHAVQAAHALPGIKSCFHLESLRATTPLPENPETRKALESCRESIARARARYDAGEYPEGMQVLLDLKPQLAGISYPPLSAEFHYVQALLQEKTGKLQESEQTLKKAVLEAEAGRDDRLLAQAWVRRVWIEGSRLTDFNEADESIDFAQAAIKRLGGDPEIEGALANHRAVEEENRGNFKEALEFIREAIRLRRQTFGQEHPKVASSIQNCANIYDELGERERALEMGEQALQMQQKLLGPTHPSVYLSLSGVSMILSRLGRVEEAGKLQDEAIALVEKSYPPDHPEIGILKSNLSVAALRTNRSSRARRLASEAIRILRRDPGPEALVTANAILNLTMACDQLEDWRGVLIHGREGISIFEKLLGPDDRSCLKLKASLGLALLMTGRIEEARSILLSALKVLENSPGPDKLRCILRFRSAQVLETRQPGEALRQAHLALQEALGVQDEGLEAEIRAWLKSQKGRN